MKNKIVLNVLFVSSVAFGMEGPPAPKKPKLSYKKAQEFRAQAERNAIKREKSEREHMKDNPAGLQFRPGWNVSDFDLVLSDNQEEMRSRIHARIGKKLMFTSDSEFSDTENNEG